MEFYAETAEISEAKENIHMLRPEYPRPQMVRPDWINLNGTWEYQTDYMI